MSDLLPGGGGTGPEQVPAWRRWVADPVLLLALVALGGAVVALRGLGAGSGGGPGWVAPALLGVVAAGLALSGST